MTWSLWLVALGLAFVQPALAAMPAGHRFDSCKEREDLYLDLATWREEPAKSMKHKVLNLVATLMLLRRGASFARMPSRAEVLALSPEQRDRLLGALQSVGGLPERAGVCVGVPDVFSSNWAVKLKESAVAEAEAQDFAGLAHEVLPRGRYCHGWALDWRRWLSSAVSRYEVQEGFAREVAHGKAVLVIRGDAPGAPSDEALRPALRLAKLVGVRTAPGDTAWGSLAAELTAQLASELREVELVLLVGLPPAAGAVLALELSMELACIPQPPQVIDGGDFMLGPLRKSDLGASGSRASLSPWQPQPRLLHIPTAILSLNGEWAFQITTDEVVPDETKWWSTIWVPMPPESQLGLGEKVSAYEAVWYRRQLEIPKGWCSKDRQLFLHVDACDWDCRIFVGGTLLFTHTGGYDPFSVELSTLPNCGAGMDLLIRAYDPTDATCEFVDEPPVPCEFCCEQGWQPRGKQSLSPSSIMYSGVTGLWRQGLWLEQLPKDHITRLGVLVDPVGMAVEVIVSARCEKRIVALLTASKASRTVMAQLVHPCKPEDEHVLRLEVDKPLQPWSPASPTLYEVTVSVDGRDRVQHVFGRRTIAAKGGRVLLNGDPLFMHGVLYQGYWPQSLTTPPSETAEEMDLLAIKEAGFNTVRVHAIVMSARFYSLCDELGLIVWQDMPAGDGRAMPVWHHSRDYAEDVGIPQSSLDEIKRLPESQHGFWRELAAMVSWVSAFTSVLVWVPFNEGWGQSETVQTVEWLGSVSKDRLINAASGWNQIPGHALGHFLDIHNYEGPPWGPLENTFAKCPYPSAGRVRTLGEYGGLGYVVDKEWTFNSSWAYGQVSRNKEDFLQALEGLFQRLELLCKSGLGAAIYTQWMDVEIEVNGLVTYDRRPKLPLGTIRQIMRKALDV